MSVTIIIPVYNASATLPSCLASLKSQTAGDLEVIFVDDCSSDDSQMLLKEFSKEAESMKVKVIRHLENRGVAAARNSGLDAATGDYVYFLDADDRLEPDAVEKMASKAGSENLDIVGCEWYLSFDKNERKMVQPDFYNPEEALRLMLLGRLRWNLWLFMVRRSLYEGVRFIPGQNMGEDMLVTGKLFLKAEKAGVLHEHLYHYSQPVLSKSFNDKLIEQVSANVAELEEAVKNSAYSEKLLPLLPQLKLNIKLPLLISADKSAYKRWTEWWPEVNSYAMSNCALPLRTRLLQWCASKHLWLAVRLYYWLVIKFLYGVVYK